MNIIYDNKAYYIQKFGGVSVLFKELQQRALSNERIQCKFVEYGDGGNSYQESLMIPQEQVIHKSNRFFGLKRLLPVDLKGSGSFVFHSTYYSYSSNPNAINVNTVLDFIEHRVGNSLGSKIRASFQGYMIKRSDVLVCISNSTKRDLLSLYPGVNEEKVKVVYLGASEAYHLIDKEDVELPFPEKSYLVYVGSRAHYKNYHLLRDIIGQTDYNLVIAGNKLSEEESKSLEKHIPSSRYVSLGYVDDERLNVLYNYAAALIYPSSYEGFGIPILEAQQAGCPVIALNTSSIPEVISTTPSECPLLMTVPTGNELLSKIRLLSDEVLMKKVISDGHKNSKRFSWNKTAEDYFNLYEKLLK